MKLRNINISTLILLALLFLSMSFFVTAQENTTTQNNVFLDSDQDGLTNAEEKSYGTDVYKPDTDGDGYSDGAEVAAGYDPLKPAPGDALVNTNINSEVVPSIVDNNSANDEATDSGNLTEELAKKISILTEQADMENSQVSMDEVNQLIGETLNSQDTTITLPEIDPKTILVKKQDYSKSQEDEKKQEDFTNYIVTVFYILTSNSPIPITSSSDIISAMTQLIQQVSLSISAQDTAVLDDLSKSGEAILDQLYQVEVPEDLVPLHIEALQYALYAQNLKDIIKTDPADPISGIVNYSKISTFIQSFFTFANDARAKINHYNIAYGEIQDKMKDFGVELPGMDEINSTLESVTKDTFAN